MNNTTVKNTKLMDCQFCQARMDSVFEVLGEDQVQELKIHQNCQVYKKGELIFHESAVPSGLFVLNTGKVKVFKVGNEGKEQIVRLAGPGDLLGYRTLLEGDHYAATAVTLEPSSVCFIPRKTFFAFLEQNHQLALRVMQLLSGDLKAAEIRLIQIAQRPVAERLAETLLMLKATFGLEPDGITLNIILTREDLANIAATATETLIRILSKFKAQKILGTKGKKILLLNIPELIRIANVWD